MNFEVTSESDVERSEVKGSGLGGSGGCGGACLHCHSELCRPSRAANSTGLDQTTSASQRIAFTGLSVLCIVPYVRATSNHPVAHPSSLSSPSSFIMVVNQASAKITGFYKQAQSRIPENISLPSLDMYEHFVTKNASSVAQIESALRSLIYLIPGTDPSPIQSPPNEK